MGRPCVLGRAAAVPGRAMLAIDRQQCQEWARACRFIVVQKGAHLKAGKATLVCACKGKKHEGGARGRHVFLSKGEPNTSPMPYQEKTCAPSSRCWPMQTCAPMVLPFLGKLLFIKCFGLALSMCLQNQPEMQGREVSTLDLQHNQNPQEKVALDCVNRLANLTEAHKGYIVSITEASIPTEDVLTCFGSRFPEAPPITAKDVQNLKTPGGGGSKDAHLLMHKLMDLQSKDNNWFVKLKQQADSPLLDEPKAAGRLPSPHP
mmetsp:Transcript_17961/g.50267  ORF Transcript_17961/g.50267 Transcript_17961/m.50267 type:complete len:261 (+) Transcript_17961:716-1498(+)